MKKTLLLIVGLVAISVSSVEAQEVVITGFPLGVGATVDLGIFEPHRVPLRALADTLSLYPRARAVIVGQADGARYSTGSDAKNPGISLGRSHALRNLLVNEFQVDSTQILIQSNSVSDRGDQYRSVSVRIERPPVDPEPFAEPVANMTPVEQPQVTVRNVTYYYEQMTLRLSAGISSTPFGAVPSVSGAVAWNHTVSLQVDLGHTFWNGSFAFKGENLKTWRRMVGGRLNVYPWQDTRLGFVGGWVRVEELAQSQHEFVKLSEGPIVGVSVIPLKHVVLVGMYNPSRHRIAGSGVALGKDGQFMVSISMFTDFGGDR